jgi:hypothetical protein
MNTKLLLRKTLIAATIAISFGALASDTGKWIASGPFAQVNVACSQAWECSAGQDILHGPDTYVWRTSSTVTWGVCSAGDGPVDGCNVCLSSPPTDPCEWELRKKE